MSTNTNEYDQQAQAFLDKHGIAFRVKLSDTKTPKWDDDTGKHHHFRVTLSKNDHKRVAFDFFGSTHDYEHGKTDLRPYDVLSCLSGDVYTPETFKDFCDEYGYDEDSRKALAMFRRCDALAKRLRAFFTESEIKDLSEIQ